MTRSFGAFAGTRPDGTSGKSSLGDVLMDAYYLRVNGLKDRLYVKEIVYGSENVTHAPLRVGSASAGTPVRVLVGHDGLPYRTPPWWW